MPSAEKPQTYAVVEVVGHPLVAHKLTILRDVRTPTAQFRQVMREISLLLAYEVSRDLKLTEIEIETPLESMTAPAIAGRSSASCRSCAPVTACSTECWTCSRLRGSAISACTATPRLRSRSNTT